MSCFNTKHLHYYGSTFKLQNSLVKPVYQKISLVGFLLFTNILVLVIKLSREVQLWALNQVSYFISLKEELYFVHIIRRFGYKSYAVVSFFYQNIWLNISLFSFVSFILKKSSNLGQMSFPWETFMSTTNKLLKFEQNDSIGKLFKNSLVLL